MDLILNLQRVMALIGLMHLSLSILNPSLYIHIPVNFRGKETLFIVTYV